MLGNLKNILWSIGHKRKKPGKKQDYGAIEKQRLHSIAKKDCMAGPGPEYVVIDITNRCNFNCIACWTYSPMIKEKKPTEKWFRQELPFTTLKKLVRDLSLLGTREIRLTGGGEPFMHPQITEIISLVKKEGLRLDITTNFSLATKNMIEKISGLGIDNLTISLWAATPETYMKTHPNQPEFAFARIISCIKDFREKSPNTKIVIANVISNINYKEIRKMAILASELCAEEIYFTMIDPVEGETNGLLLSKLQQEHLAEEFAKLIEEQKNGTYNSLKIDNPENFMRRIKNKGARNGSYDSGISLEMPCTAGWTFSRIMADGSVAPCCRGVMVPTGNINNQSFIEIWNGHRQKSFRRIGLALKEHPGFVKKVGCEKTCDNLMQNLDTYNKIKKLGFP